MDTTHDPEIDPDIPKDDDLAELAAADPADAPDAAERIAADLTGDLEAANAEAGEPGAAD